MQGQLFSQDFLLRGIRETPPFEALTDADRAAFHSALRAVFRDISPESTLNEAQTEQLIIERVLAALGWGEDYLPQEWDSARRGFYAHARSEARLYEEKVSRDLGERVFADIFPRLAEALCRGDLLARAQKTLSGTSCRQRYARDYLDEAREAALVLLYRLLFLFYAEDRGLLPVRDERYAAYSVRRLRERVRDEMEAAKVHSRRLDNLWRKTKPPTAIAARKAGFSRAWKNSRPDGCRIREAAYNDPLA